MPNWEPIGLFASSDKKAKIRPPLNWSYTAPGGVGGPGGGEKGAKTNIRRKWEKKKREREREQELVNEEEKRGEEAEPVPVFP